MTRLIPSETLEQELRLAGHRLIAGLDEVGRGAWAGPLVVGTVILPANRRILKLRDSKLLSRVLREKLARRIKRLCQAWAIGVVTVAELNLWGLAKSLGIAAQRAVDGLSVKPDLLVVDGKDPFRDLTLPQQMVIGGDQRIRSIAAAAVIAKVERDQMLRTLHRQEKGLRRYRFDLNKGYPSPHHRAMLQRYGPSPHHRLSFAPVRATQTQARLIEREIEILIK